jgi:hypothetical protein
MKKDKAGDLIVFAGTNEIGIVLKESGKGYFSQRRKHGTVGEVAIIGKLPDKYIDLYWKNHKNDF